MASTRYVTWTIKKATPTITPPTARTDLVYDGTEQTLVNAGSVSGGTMEYNFYPGGSGWSTNVPTAVNASGYSVQYRVVGGTNYEDIAPQYVTPQSQIMQADPQLTLTPSTLALLKGQTATVDATWLGGGAISASVTSGAENIGISVSGGTITVTASETNAGNATILVTCSGSGNYRSGSATVSVAVYGNLTYYGTITPLSIARYMLAAANVGNYVLAMGGGASRGLSAVVDAYDQSFTRSNPANITMARSNLTAVNAGEYALALGGSYGSGSFNNEVDAYDSSLTHTRITTISPARSNLASAKVGNYALVMGGTKVLSSAAGTTTSSDAVDAYDTSLTRSAPAALSVARAYPAGASVGNYALVMGGKAGTSSAGTASSVVDAYDASLTRTTPMALSQARYQLAGLSNGNYAIAAGGHDGSTRYDTVDAYDSSLVRTTPTALSYARQQIASATVGDYALAMGGINGSSRYDTVDAFDLSLTRITPTGMSVGRYGLAGAASGNYAFAMGGHSSAVSSVVDVYTTS